MSIRRDVDLQDFNTLRAPAVARHLAELHTPADLEPLLLEARERDWPITVLGEGSNVVLGDVIPGLVLLQRCRGIEVESSTDSEVLVRVAAGENWHDFVRWTLDQGYCGLENLALIPGTVGAAPIQNVGAYGVEVKDFIETVHCRDLTNGRPVLYSQAECQFGYRDSIFKSGMRDLLLIEAVTFRLPRDRDPVTDYPSLADWLSERGIEAPGPRDVFDAVVAIRSARLPDPAETPNVGSFFKNPRVSAADFRRIQADYPDMPFFRDSEAYKLPAAWLIERCGFKERSDPVREIMALAVEIRDAVFENFGLQLEQEPRAYNTVSHG